mmetsp:Transcript_40908/g.87867  ORF Transcript_40908/g.87867 Transcript_40908/m.87867 type:complete len:110 (-) Transcript_40908:380-709(-)
MSAAKPGYIVAALDCKSERPCVREGQFICFEATAGWATGRTVPVCTCAKCLSGCMAARAYDSGRWSFNVVSAPFIRQACDSHMMMGCSVANAEPDSQRWHALRNVTQVL